jgi:hypothetical protein
MSRADRGIATALCRLTRGEAMSGSFDLNRYFAHIGYDCPRAATRDVLRGLQRWQPLAIPFENRGLAP